MGTSGSSKGSDSRTPLVPTWLDNPSPGPLPGSDGGPPPPDQGGDGPPDTEAPIPAIEPSPIPKRFQSARTNFSRFARSGGNDGVALRRAVRDYVRSGTQGSSHATQRMGSSRTAASNALGVFRGIQRDGIQTTLQYLNLNQLVGGSVQEVFIGFTEVICEDGGSIDEGIARDAWLETVTELDQIGIDDLETLTTGQIQELFLHFIANTIETRLYQEIGVRGFQYAETMNDIENFDTQFKHYVQLTVRDSFASDLADLSAMSDQTIRDIVDQTYSEAWDLFITIGDRAG